MMTLLVLACLFVRFTLRAVLVFVLCAGLVGVFVFVAAVWRALAGGV